MTTWTPEEIAKVEGEMAEAEKWKYVCRDCEKTPQDIGWCERCGYNRQYIRLPAVTVQ